MNTIHIEHEERWVWVYLNWSSCRNALNIELLNELRIALTELELNVTVCAVILIGEGNAFCSGLDLEELQQMH